MVPAEREVNNSAASTKTSERILWVDIARGLCVAAVVIMHTVLSLNGVLEHTQVETMWSRIVDLMTPFRMPSLALLSGILLARRIRAGWGDRGAWHSVAQSYWLYVVWLTVFLVMGVTVGYAMWLGPFGAGPAIDAFRTYVDQLVMPRSVLWYVLALAVWTAILTTLHRSSPAAVLLVLAAVSLISYYVPADGSDQYRNMMRYFVFFAVGVYFSQALREKITKSPVQSGLVAVIVFLGVTAISGIGRDGNVGNVLTMPRDLSGSVLIMVLSVALAAIPLLGRALAWVGRRTLTIYVMHIPLVELLMMYPDWWIGALENTVVRALAPLIITLVIMAVAVGVHTIAMRTPARVLFQLPDAWRRRILTQKA